MLQSRMFFTTTEFFAMLSDVGITVQNVSHGFLVPIPLTMPFSSYPDTPS